MDLSTKLEGLGLEEEKVDETSFKDIDTPLKFLKICFPTYDDEHLISKLEACDGDIENTVDVISNDELRNLEIFGVEIDSFTTQEETAHYQPKKPVIEPSKRQYNTPGNFSKARRNQRENRPNPRQFLKQDDFPDLPANDTSVHTNSLPSLVSPPPRQHQPQPQPREFRQKPRQVFKKDDFPDLLSNNAPVHTDSLPSLISQQLPPPLPSLEPSVTIRHQEEFEEDLSQLASIFPDQDVQVLSGVLQTSTSLENAIDNVLKNLDSYKAKEKSSRSGSKTKLLYSGQKNILEIHDNSEAELLRLKKAPNYSAYRVQSIEDPDYCRRMAIENITKRNELFMKAARAFSGKTYGSGGVAFFYSQEGKSYDSKVKQWNARAAQATLMQNQLRVHDDHTVDLHGLTVAQALAVVKDTVNDWYSREEMKSGRSYFKPLTIITGLGNNSPSYNSRLGPAVTNRLNKEGWKLDVSRKGFVIVKGVKM